MCLVWIKVQPQSQRCSISSILLFHYNNMSSAKHLSIYLSWSHFPDWGMKSHSSTRRLLVHQHGCVSHASTDELISRVQLYFHHLGCVQGPTSYKIPYQLFCLPALLRWSSLVTSLVFPEMEMLSHFMILLQPKAASPAMQQSAGFIHLCGLAWRGSLSQS